MNTPTNQLYGALEKIYNHFNLTLFNDQLPPVLFTTQRKKNCMGYFSYERWINDQGSRCNEIAINPLYVGRSALIELLQTMAHEQAHCWQFHFGTPSRKTYHNKEWADKMESIGLMPSTTGAPGGKRTGQKMSDYPLPEGRFIQECKKLIEDDFIFPWIDRHALQLENRATLPEVITNLDLEDDLLAQLTTSIDCMLDESEFSEPEATQSKTKKTYICPDCETKVWGKPGLNIACCTCNKKFSEL